MFKGIRVFSCSVILGIAMFSTAFGSELKATNTIGNWETSIIIDGKQLVTRAAVNEDKEVSIKLRELMDFLGYKVTWNDKKRTVIAETEADKITIFVDANKCDKNGSIMYVKNPVYIDENYTYMPLTFVQTVFDIHTLNVDKADNSSNRINGIELITIADYDEKMQKEADNGKELWQLDPEQVAYKFATETLGFEGTTVFGGKISGDWIRVDFSTQNSDKTLGIDVYQPVRKGTGGIWAAEGWYDSNHKHYLARDLSKLKPLFKNNNDIPLNIRDTFREVVVKEWTEAFGKHYKVLGFEAQEVLFIKSNDKVELKFHMIMVTQNFYKDPDTVEYIRVAKEKGSSEYQTLYDEYNLAHKGSFDLKIIASIGSSGDLIKDTIQILSNVSPHGEDYKSVIAEDFIIKSE